MISVGFLHSRIRVEEKLLLEELNRHPQIEIVRINDGANFFDIPKSQRMLISCWSVQSRIHEGFIYRGFSKRMAYRL